MFSENILDEDSVFDCDGKISYCAVPVMIICRMVPEFG